MADSKANYQKLPPGWDCKFDQATGNCYYINYLTRAMQLEDPRLRYKQLQNDRCSTESIPMQPFHGSPYHVYPSNNLPAMRAFQGGPGTNHSLQNTSSSPLLSSRGNLEMSPIPYPKSSIMQTPRLAHMSRRSTIQETSFSNQIDTDAVVTKIQNIFPTASEDHIRLLLKRYYNREAVVISALQVEKHPVTMPGPFVTPPAQRHLFHSNSAFHMTPPARRLDIGAQAAYNLYGSGSTSSRTASPIPGGRFGSAMSMMHGGGGIGGVGRCGGADGGFGYAVLPFHHHGSPRFGNEQWRSSPKPHSSPKMKLRYMKSIFPKADEMLLLDVLANADNNVQIASEKLISMGYAKRECAPPKLSNHEYADGVASTSQKKPGDEKIIPLRPKEYTQEDKEAMQKHLKEKYPQIVERIILMALESVNYAEDRAIQILQIVQEEDETRAKKHTTTLATTMERDEETTIDGGANEVDNIITVVLETTDDHEAQPPQAQSLSKAAIAAKKRAFPSINVTTPTTATTQIILSNSPICIDNETQPHEMLATQKPHESSSSAAKKSAAMPKATSSNSTDILAPTPTSITPPISSSSPTSSSPPPSTYQPFTAKSILARSTSSGFGVNGYLHGTAYSTPSSYSAATNNSSACILEKLKLSRSRDKSDSLKNSQRDSTEEDVDHLQRQEFKSLLGRIATMGHNNELSNGPDENLLLADYVTWNGANPDISLGHKQVNAGASGTNVSERAYNPLGRNPELCKGPKVGLAKGSIYAQLSVGSGKSANIKCN